MFLDYGVTLGPMTAGDKHRNAKSLGFATIFGRTEPSRLLSPDAGASSLLARIPLRSNGLRAGWSPSD